MDKHYKKGSLEYLIRVLGKIGYHMDNLIQLSEENREDVNEIFMGLQIIMNEYIRRYAGEALGSVKTEKDYSHQEVES